MTLLLDVLWTFLVALSAVLYVPIVYYSYKLAAGKGERKLFLLLVAVIMLCLRRVYDILHGLPPDIVDALLADIATLSMAIATAAINKLFTEIFKPIILSGDKDRPVK